MISKDISVPISSVTLMEDRAHIIRKEQVEIEFGDQQIRIEGLSPFIVDKSLRFADKNDLKCKNLRIERASLVETQKYPEENQNIYTEQKSLEEQLTDLENEHHLQSVMREDINNLRDSLLENLEMEVNKGKADPNSWKSYFDCLSEEETEISSSIHDIELKIQETTKKLELKSEELELWKKKNQDSATLHLDLDCKRKGVYELKVEYLVPCAGWRPSYTAILNKTESKIDFKRCASVWQNTGEAWENVDLNFSTQRASLGTEIPKLNVDYISTRKKDSEIQLSYSEEDTNEFNEIKVMNSLPGIDDRGASITLKSIHKASIPSDGHMVKIELGSFESECNSQLISYPELVDAVVLKTKSTNTSSEALLAGPVELIKAGAFVGSSSIDYIQTGESFSLDWGNDFDIVINRKIEKKYDDKLLSSWRSEEIKVKLRLSNLSQSIKRFTLTERIPISDIEQVQVEFSSEKTTQNRLPNQHGFITWDIFMSAKEKQELTLVYTIKKKNEVRG